MKTFKTVSFTEAQNISLSLSNKKMPIEWISISCALDRILAQDITCIKDLPAFNNAAMDGFAFRHSDSGKTLKIKETVFAGAKVAACLGDDECYKIMTGAQVPDDADTIIPFENCISYDESQAVIGEKIKKGFAYRVKGEEQKVGNILFKAGEPINSQVIAMLASQGISMITVYKQISVAVFSSGDELREPWERANGDEIYNVNSSSLTALLQEQGICADYCGVIPDNLEASIEYFSRLKKYDALITSGGISMGEADFIEEALIQNGFKTAFHGINIKPGKPTMFGVMDETIVASMPGNPLAAYVNAFLFLIPVLKKLQGDTKVQHQKILAKNAETFSVKSGRSNIVLGSLDDGAFRVCMQNKYGSGMLSPIMQSNAILITDESVDIVEKDAIITVLHLRGIF